MKEEKIIFVKQMINSLTKKLEDLSKAREENDPNKFNDLKKDCIKLNEQIGDLIK